MLTDTAVATAADYADALVTLRRAKSLVVLVIALALLAQIALFLTARFTDALGGAAPVAVAAVPTTLPLAGDALVAPVAAETKLYFALAYGTVVALTAAVVCAFVLPLVLAAIGHVMLVGRLIGVGSVAGAFALALVLLAVLFPWQAVLNTSLQARHDLVIPGALTTWVELSTRARPVAGEPAAAQVLTYARFLGYPLAALVVTLAVGVKSGRGLRLALGEADLVAAADRRAAVDDHPARAEIVRAGDTDVVA